jgi:hypothetical protein
LSESPFEQKDLIIGNYGLKDYEAVEEGISTNHPFVVYLDLELTKAITTEVRLKFYDATGALIFTCSSGQEGTGRMKELGKYRVAFQIPANLLNTRFYSVELRVINMDKQSLMFKADKFIAIKMADASVTGDAGRESILQGLVKPLIPASVTKLG